MDNQTQTPQQAIVDKIKDCKNILVTVSSNPSVDQLAACLGLTIWLNKIDKHATAVFSGEVPSTLEFLQPADTLEKNTDSLRDFIISLDKSKADKLRYKVEDSVVKVFVTPYRTSLSADDLEFSQGDFNVDMVIALGVHRQDELDVAITAHGRILHDATVATITIGDVASELGAISWHVAQASSLSELVVEITNGIDKDKLDSQIATALLTGIVAETARFSNEKTTPQTMSVSAQLMSAGANQQLVATKLDEPAAPAPAVESVDVDESVAESVAELPAPVDDGAIMIEHQAEIEPLDAEPDVDVQPEADVDSKTPPEAEIEPEPVVEEQTPESEPAPAPEEPAIPVAPPIEELTRHEEKVIEPIPGHMDPFQPPPPDWMPAQPWMSPAPAADQPLPATDFSGLPASSEPAELEQPPIEVVAPDPTPEQPLVAPTPPEPPVLEAPLPPEAPEPVPPLMPETPEPPVSSEVPAPTMDELNRDLDSARDEVMRAIQNSPAEPAPEPVQALNALPIDLNPPAADPAPLPADQATFAAPLPPQTTQFDPTAFGVANDPEVTPPAPVDPDLTGPVEQPYTMPLPSSLTPPPANPTPPTSVEFDPTAPPPVPPPMPFGKV